MRFGGWVYIHQHGQLADAVRSSGTVRRWINVPRLLTSADWCVWETILQNQRAVRIPHLHRFSRQFYQINRANLNAPQPGTPSAPQQIRYQYGHLSNGYIGRDGEKLIEIN